jgi:hypothetical protein
VWGREQARDDRRRGQSSGQGGGSAPTVEQKQREQRVCRGRRREGKIRRTDLENLKSPGVSQ